MVVSNVIPTFEKLCKAQQVLCTHPISNCTYVRMKLKFNFLLTYAYYLFQMATKLLGDKYLLSGLKLITC